MNCDQLIVQEFVENYKLDSPIEFNFIDLVSELGEIAKAINLITNNGKSIVKESSELLEEIGDAHYSLLTFVNYFEVDLSELLEKAIKKSKERS
jgi:NTP pyrophosphatase (non-canonical NTP hydrolase)